MVERTGGPSKRIYPHPKLLVIPSWGKLLGYPTLGKYKNHKITKITTDPLIFLSNFEATTVESGHIKHFLFGIGFYFVKFQIDEGKYIVDHRRLSGLVLSDFVYQFIMDSPDISLVQDAEVVLKECAYSIPLDIEGSTRTENQISFIKGVIARELFFPYKEILAEFANLIQYSLDFKFLTIGHALLMATHEAFDMIYVSETATEAVHSKYLQSTPGVIFYTTGADYVLQNHFSLLEIQYIKEQIILLEELYRTRDFDPSELFQYFKGGEEVNRIQLLGLAKTVDFGPDTKLLAEPELSAGIFVSSPDYVAPVPWDANHPRRTLQSYGIESAEPTAPRPLAMTELESSEEDVDLTNYKQGPTEAATEFKLDIHKQPKVEARPLPALPEDSVKSILLYLQKIVLEKYEMQKIGEAFGHGRDKIRQIAFHTEFVWEMSKFSNQFLKGDPGCGLTKKDEQKALGRLGEWIAEIEEEERQEMERLERERKEQEERGRLKRKWERKEHKKRVKAPGIATGGDRQKYSPASGKATPSVPNHNAQEQSYEKWRVASNEISTKGSGAEVAAMGSGEIYTEFQYVMAKIEGLNHKLEQIRGQTPESRFEKRFRKKQQKQISRHVRQLKKQLKKLQKKMKKHKK